MTSQTAVWSLLTQPQETCQQRRGLDLGIDASWRLASDQLAGTMVSPQSHGSVPRPRLGRPYAHHCLRVTAHSSQLSLQSLLRLTIRPSLTTNDHYCPHWHWSQGCHWPLLTTTDYYRPPKSTTDHHWPLMTNATDHYKPPVTTTDYYRLLLTSTDHYWPLLTTTDYYWPLQTTTDHYRPLKTTTDHYWSLQTTTDHYRASLTTTDYYWPRSPCAEHLVWVQSAPLQGLSHAAELTPAVYSTPAVWTCEKTLTSCQMHSTAPDVSMTDRQTHYNNTDRHTNSPLTVHNHTFSTLWLLIIVHYTNTLTYLFTYLHTVTTYEWHILVD